MAEPPLDMARRRIFEAAEELRHHRALAARDGGPVDSDLRTREAARTWSWPWLDQLQRSHYALRGIRRAPGFAATVIGR
jgi:hypothetical protein